MALEAKYRPRYSSSHTAAGGNAVELSPEQEQALIITGSVVGGAAVLAGVGYGIKKAYDHFKNKRKEKVDAIVNDPNFPADLKNAQPPSNAVKGRVVATGVSQDDQYVLQKDLQPKAVAVVGEIKQVINNHGGPEAVANEVKEKVGDIPGAQELAKNITDKVGSVEAIEDVKDAIVEANKIAVKKVEEEIAEPFALLNNDQVEKVEKLLNDGSSYKSIVNKIVNFVEELLSEE